MIAKKKLSFFLLIILFLIMGTTMVSASENTTQTICEEDSSNVDYNQHDLYMDSNDNQAVNENNIDKSYVDESKASGNSGGSNQLKLNTTVENKSVSLVYDTGKEVVITKNITTVNGKPDVTKLGVDYAYADENGVYTILGSEIRRVMKLDSYCQQVYGYVPKYTFFRKEGSNVKYVISREKWNVIARSLNAYHVKKGYESVQTPYSITVNLSNQKYYYSVYYDAQEWINGHQYTCGPTAMSMISQALNCYASEKKLAGTYSTTAADGTDEYKIIKYSPLVHMKLTDITDNKSSVKKALLNGAMVFWHIRGHYMCIIGYNEVKDTFLCLNPSGPSHNINAVQWATWTQVMNTDRALKENGFMKVTPYWNLTTLDKNHAKYYYYNMGGKYVIPNNSEYPNKSISNYKVTVDSTKTITTTNQTVLHIKAEVKLNSKLANVGDVEIYLNNKLLGTKSVSKGVVTLDYTLPAYMENQIEVKAKYFTFVNNSKYVENNFYKFSAGKSFVNSTNLGNLEGIKVFDVTGKKGDVVSFKALVQDSSGLPINSGKVVFKLNGNTLKKDGQPQKIKVTNGTAILKFEVPAYSAKKYTLTAVFGNDSVRLEDNAIFTINKLNTKISKVNLTHNKNTLKIYAQVIDENNDKVERDTKISVKINGKTLVNKVKVQNGIISMDIDISDYTNRDLNITIIAGENGLYRSSTLNQIYSTSTQKPIKITDFKSSLSGNTGRFTAKVVDVNGNSISNDLKASLKINGKTLLNKIILKNGNIDMKVDLSAYKSGTHNVTVIIGESTNYRSTSLNATFVKT